MSSSTNLSNSILNIEPSKLTHTASGGVGDVSGSYHTIDLRLNCSSYEWVGPRILDIPTCFRGPNDLDNFLSKVSILKPDSPSNAVVADSCGHNSQVCDGRESAPQVFFFVYNTFFNDFHVILPFDEFTMGSFGSLMLCHPNSWVTLQAFRIICDILKLLPTPQSFYFIIILV